jgi:hypothetical protein
VRQIDIENLIAAAINEPGDCAALNDIHAPTLQRETVADQLAHNDDLCSEQGFSRAVASRRIEIDQNARRSAN